MEKLIEIGPNEIALIVVDCYDEGLACANAIARQIDKRTWHYFTFTKPVLVDFGDYLILNCLTFDVYSYRNPHLKYRLQKSSLSPSIMKALTEETYDELDEVYKKHLPDGYNLGDQNG
jgi:hypothetical protein